jgi:hypothetical protein
MNAHRITKEWLKGFRGKLTYSNGMELRAPGGKPIHADSIHDILDALESAYAELDRKELIELSDECRGLLVAHGSDGTIIVAGEFSSGQEFREKYRLHADGMPRDREELQKLLGDAYRKGNQEAHEAHRLVREMGLSAQGGEANNLEDALSETEADRDRLAAELQAVRDDLAAAHEEILLSRQSEGETMADLLRTREKLATSGPSCDRCQSSHCCSVAGCTPPLCVTDPDGSLPLWMPWANEDVRTRIDAVYAQVDALHAELARVRRDHLRRMAQRAEDLADRMAWSQRRAMQYARFAERCRHAIADDAKDET